MAKKWCLNLVTESKKTPPKLQKSQKSVNLNWNNSTRIDLWKESLCLWTKYTNWSRNKINRTTGYCRWLFCFFLAAFVRCRKRNEFLLIFPKSGKSLFIVVHTKRQLHAVPHESMNMWFCLCRETLNWKLYVLLLKSRERYLRGQGMCWNVLDQNKWFIKTDSMKV